jgi:hypothetical protein
MSKTIKQIRENHIGALQTLDQKISHLSPDKQVLAKRHHSLANAAAMRSSVKEAEKHFSEFRRIVGEETGWQQGSPKPGSKSPVKLNNGDMGKITHEIGSNTVVVTTRDGWKKTKRSEIAAHHVSESVAVKEGKGKFLGKFRGTTATGQPANIVDIDPQIKFNSLRKRTQIRGL